MLCHGEFYFLGQAIAKIKLSVVISLIYLGTLKQICQSKDVLRELYFLRCFGELRFLTMKDYHAVLSLTNFEITRSILNCP